MNQVELTKYEFDYRGIPKLIALSSTSGRSRFHCMEKVISKKFNQVVKN